MNEQIEIIRSKRKTLSIEIKQDLRVIVRAPDKMKRTDIDSFVEEKRQWIEKHLDIMRQRQSEMLEKTQICPLSEEEIEQLSKRAQRLIPIKVEEFAKIIGVSYGRVTVRRQISRWGSCSARGNLNFNCLLMLCPDEVLDYVVIHELCHRKYMNHSKDFWSTVERYCPDYRQSRAWLKNNGAALINGLRAALDK